MPLPANLKPLINGQQLPTRLEQSGKYRFVPSHIEGVRDGNGLLLRPGKAYVEWTWANMQIDEYDHFWRYFPAGRDSVLIDSARLWLEDMQTLYDFGTCILDKPVYEDFYNSLYINCMIRISQLTFP